MIWKTIVAAALLLTFPALADDTGKKDEIAIEHSDHYVFCVALALEQLSAYYGPKAGEDVQDLGRRWEKTVSKVCKGTLTPRMEELRSFYGDEVRPVLYLYALNMTMRQVVYFRAKQEYEKEKTK